MYGIFRPVSLFGSWYLNLLKLGTTSSIKGIFRGNRMFVLHRYIYIVPIAVTIVHSNVCINYDYSWDFLDELPHANWKRGLRVLYYILEISLHSDLDHDS
jgi:hypothetical protein